MMTLFFGILAFICTFLGGLFALRFKDHLHLVLGFSAGALLGVAFFDLLPESISLTAGTYDVSTATFMIAVGFVVFLLLDRFIAPHSHGDELCENESHRGRLGAGGLSIHSFLDGMVIGLAFKVSLELGAIVTVAVLVHDFSDGINTVSLILKNGGKRREALRWLALDSLAPIAGVLSTFLFSVSEATLGIILSLFCGFFLYIGASDLLPESHHRHPTMWTTLATVLGISLLYVVIQIAG
jgi:ZIP family zinc transporter